MLRYAAAVVMGLAVAGPAGAQGGPITVGGGRPQEAFEALLSGSAVPHSLKLKELNADWRRVAIKTPDAAGGMGDMMKNLMQAGAMSEMGKGGKGKDDAMGAMLGMSMLGGMFGGGGGDSEPVYYTKGQTVGAGGETFLVAYRWQKPEMNFMQMAMESQANGGKEPDFAKMAEQGKMTPDSTVTLTLINVKTIGTMSGIRPFDMKQEIADSAKAGNGLLDMLMQQGANEAKPAEVTAPVPAAKKPAPKPAPKKKG